jgi:hypothetical protein
VSPEEDLIPIAGGEDGELSPYWPMNLKSSSLPQGLIPSKRSTPIESSSLSTPVDDTNSPPTLAGNGRPNNMARSVEQHRELRTSSRTNKGHYSESNPQSYQRFALLVAFLGAASSMTDLFEPKSVKQAKGDIMWKEWLEAMALEYKSLADNKTWTLVTGPENRKVLCGKWVYKLKRGPEGEILRYKARWVVRGFEQEEGIDYGETFASVVKPMSYKALFAIAAALDLDIEQIDVKTAFLYGDIDEEIYVEQPHELADGTNRVCRLNKALYGLKQLDPRSRATEGDVV